MSLVGNLEDLGFGDILQIVHLSGKSGVLCLRSERGSAEVLFEKGLIRAAFHKAGPKTLEELLSDREVIEREALNDAVQDAKSRGCSLETVLLERALFDAESLEQLRRDHIEAALLEMFRWSSGDFSFEVKEIQGEGEGFFSTPGVNPQFIALEGTRMVDESAFGGEEIEFSTEGDAESGSNYTMAESAAVAESSDDVSPSLRQEDLQSPEKVEDEEAGVVTEADWVSGEEDQGAYVEEATVIASAHVEGEGVSEASLESPIVMPEEDAEEIRSPLILVDPQLPVLEWAKVALQTAFARVHIFQRTDLAIHRVRQYLSRAEVPLVVLSKEVPPDPVSGAEGPFELLRRLRRQSDQIVVALLVEEGEPVQSPTDAAPNIVVYKPSAQFLLNPRRAEECNRMGESLQQDLIAVTRSIASLKKPSKTPSLEQLRETSARLRGGGASGEVLPQVMDFAAQTFERVALFIVREQVASGIAEVGLSRAGGPDESALREVHIDMKSCGLFRAVLETSVSQRGSLRDAGEQQLAVLLGNEIPNEAYVAPIQTADGVVALLYGDNLPANRPIGDTATLEVLLDSAGIALERALLERELAAAAS